MEKILEVKDLSVGIKKEDREAEIVREVSFDLNQGEVLAIVGESGCGKTILCKSLMGLLPKSAYIKSGQILVEGQDIAGFSEKQLQEIRGTVFSMIFQNPMSSLNPTISIGEQIREAITIHDRKISKKEGKKRAIACMESVGIKDSEKRYGCYPHNFSGGMAQRSVLAMALSLQPKILIADEPTTALDVTMQAQMLELFCKVRGKLGTTMIFVTHDLGVVAEIADRVAVMYAGKIVERGMTEEVFYEPRHPYTIGLMKSLPFFSKERAGLNSIKGMPPDLMNLPKGDAFASRNPYALKIDYEEMPPLFQISETHYAATWLLDERAPKEARKIWKVE